MVVFNKIIAGNDIKNYKQLLLQFMQHVESNHDGLFDSHDLQCMNYLNIALSKLHRVFDEKENVLLTTR